MEKNSVQSQEVSDLTENPAIEVETKSEVTQEDVTSQMPEDWKNDFFKHKAKMKTAISEKEALEAKVKEYEEKENLAKGNFQKIIDTLKEENKSLKTKIDTSEKQKQLDKFNSKLQAKAEELGFTKPERIMNFISDKDMELLKIDQDYNVDDTGLDIAFQNIKKEWGELFKPKQVKVADGVPKTNLNTKPQKTVKEMTSAERIALALELSRKNNNQ